MIYSDRQYQISQVELNKLQAALASHVERQRRRERVATQDRT